MAGGVETKAHHCKQAHSKGTHMKKCVKLAIILATVAFGAPAFGNPQSVPGSAPVVPSPAVAGDGPEMQIQSVADFNQPLGQLGSWIDVGGGQRGWHPKEVGSTWRPYVNGKWVWTDAGWFWASNEPWAWATYHYGSWIDQPATGWVWIPGTEWAPAWVDWRMGGNYIGWAPFAPAGATAASAAFVFVDVRHFTGPLTLSIVLKNNSTILDETKPIEGNRRERRNREGHGEEEMVVNEGPGIDAIQKTTGQRINAVPVQQLRQQTAASSGLTGGANTRGNTNTNFSPTGRPDNGHMTPTNQPGQPVQPGQQVPPDTSGMVVPPPNGGLTNQPPLTNSTPNFPTNGNLPPTGRPNGQVPPDTSATVPPTVPPAGNLNNNQPPLTNSTPRFPQNGNVPPNGPVTPQLPPQTTPQPQMPPPAQPPPTPVVPRGTGG